MSIVILGGSRTVKNGKNLLKPAEKRREDILEANGNFLIEVWEFCELLKSQNSSKDIFKYFLQTETRWNETN